MKIRAIVFLFICIVLLPVSAQQPMFEQYKQQQQAKYRNYKSDKQKQYDAYRQKLNKEYADYMAKQWTAYKSYAAVKKPEDQDLPQPDIKTDIGHDFARKQRNTL